MYVLFKVGTTHYYKNKARYNKKTISLPLTCDYKNCLKSKLLPCNRQPKAKQYHKKTRKNKNKIEN